MTAERLRAGAEAADERGPRGRRAKGGALLLLVLKLLVSSLLLLNHRLAKTERRGRGSAFLLRQIPHRRAPSSFVKHSLASERSEARAGQEDEITMEIAPLILAVVAAAAAAAAAAALLPI